LTANYSTSPLFNVRSAKLTLRNLVRKAPADTAFTDVAVEKGALTLKGLPWKVTEEDLVQFFEGYNYIPESLKWQVNAEGKKTGLAAVLFESA